MREIGIGDEQFAEGDCVGLARRSASAALSGVKPSFAT